MSEKQSIVSSWITEEVYHLLINAGKPYTFELKKMALKDPDFLDLLVKIFLTDEEKLCWHAGWVLYKTADTHKHLLENHLPAIIEKLPNMLYYSQCHGALRIIQYFDITDESQQGILVNLCMKFIHLNKYPPYMKYFSIIIIDKITKYYPELKNELALTIETAMPHWTTSYIKIMGGKKLLEYSKES